MATSVLYAEGDIQRDAIFAFDAASGLFKAVTVNAAGELVVGGAVKVADAAGVNLLAVNAFGQITAQVQPNPLPVTDNAGSLTVDQATAANLKALVDQGAAGATRWLTEDKPYAPAAADVLAGRATRLNTVNAVTVVTVPATRTFVGSATISVVDAVAAAVTRVSADLRTAGATVTPAAGTILGEILTHHGGTAADSPTLTVPDIVVVAGASAATIDFKLSLANADFEGVAAVRGVLL